jgi:hypothetical protein
MPNQVVRERETNHNKPKLEGGARGTLVGVVIADIVPWRKLRDSKFEDLWDEFYAKWRGFWMPQHKSFKTERSRIISPLTSMSIDLTSAEIIEAVLGREYFIDLPDDVGDADSRDVEAARKLLVQDLKNSGFIDEFALTALNGCLYGTGITKIQISTKVNKTLSRDKAGKLVVTEREVVVVKPVAIEPGQFVADPSTRDIDDMKGCAHEFLMPLSTLKGRQLSGQYYGTTVGAFKARVISKNRGDTEEGNTRDQGEVAYITEYYGEVPLRDFQAAVAEGKGTPLSNEMIQAIPESATVEAIITIANETTLLRAIKNPLMTGERLIVSYQHEAVPGRFYGRGVAEKAANVQRAMDAEMRARIDGLAWSNMPMFAGDLTRLPPNSNMNAWPGKMWGTRGNPNDVLKEFKVSSPDQNSYAHVQDLERMGQQATGALDSQGLRQGVRDESATGSALAASSFIKRSKRTMYNIEGYMNKLVKRVLRLKMQYEPSRYPQDYEFQVKGSIGIMAREIEASFMVNMLSVIGADSPASMPIIRAIFEHSGSPVRAEVLQALKAIEEKKPSPEEEAAKQAQLALPVAQLKKIQAETEKLIEEAELKEAQAEKTDAETKGMPEAALIKRANVANDMEDGENVSRGLDIQEEKNRLTEKGLDIQAKALKKDK